MKNAIAMRMTAVKKITAAILGLLCAAVWLIAVLYFSFTIEF
jgi:hypothetical protein